MTNNDIREIIDALNDGIDICIALEKNDTHSLSQKKVLNAEDGLLHSKNMLHDLLNGK